MGWGTPDVYHQPEELGLEIIGEVEPDDECYSFNMFVVWRSVDGNEVYYGSDAGCSCPSPFEDYRSHKDLSRVDKFQDFLDALAEWRQECEGYKSPRTIQQLRGDCGDLAIKVQDALRRRSNA